MEPHLSTWTPIGPAAAAADATACAIATPGVRTYGDANAECSSLNSTNERLALGCRDVATSGLYKLGSRSIRFLFLLFSHPINGCLVLITGAVLMIPSRLLSLHPSTSQNFFFSGVGLKGVDRKRCRRWKIARRRAPSSSPWSICACEVCSPSRNS